MLDVRLNLARIAVFEGETDRATRILERGLNLSGIHPQAAEALRMLARLKRSRGKVDDAEILEGLLRRMDF